MVVVSWSIIDLTYYIFFEPAQRRIDFKGKCVIIETIVKTKLSAEMHLDWYEKKQKKYVDLIKSKCDIGAKVTTKELAVLISNT
jgi:hypothetical protein